VQNTNIKITHTTTDIGSRQRRLNVVFLVDWLCWRWNSSDCCVCIRVCGATTAHKYILTVTVYVQCTNPVTLSPTLTLTQNALWPAGRGSEFTAGDGNHGWNYYQGYDAAGTVFTRMVTWRVYLYRSRQLRKSTYLSLIVSSFGRFCGIRANSCAMLCVALPPFSMRLRLELGIVTFTTTT